MKYLSGQRGIIMIGAFIVTLFFLISSLAVAEFGVSHYSSARRTLQASGALNAAEAGADAFMAQINANSNYQGTNSAPSGTSDSCSATPSPVTLVNNASQGKVTYESCVKNGSISGEKQVITTGKVYLPATSSTPKITRKVRLIINQSLPKDFTIMSGPGGLSLANNVRITAGPVYVGGKLSLSSNATVGSVATPTSVYVADKSCPIPATSAFPMACTSGNSISTANNAQVYGDTHPLNNVDMPSRFTNPGVVDHTVPPINLPNADHAELTGSVAGTKTMGSATCTGGTMRLSGHYTGAATSSISPSNNCTVILDGDTWIDGSLTLSNNNTLTVNPSLSSAPNLIIDGSTGFATGNNNFITANSNNVGINVYTFWSADTSCRPNCSDVTGAALASSQNLTTINLRNNVNGSANIKFYARWTRLVLANNATVGQLIGQTITLNNNGNIQFANTTSTTVGGWDVRYYEQLYQ